MSNSVNFNYLGDYGILAMNNFRNDVETFQIAKIEEGKEIQFLETADNYFVPMISAEKKGRTRPVKADIISLPESVIKGEAKKRTIIGDPVTLAFDLLKKLGIDIDLGIGFKYEKESIVQFCFENIQCQARAVSFDESLGSVKKVLDEGINKDGFFYIDSIVSYIKKSKIDYNSPLGKERIDKFVEEITVDETFEAKSEREKNRDSGSRKTEKNKPKYYIVSTVFKSNKFKVSFYNSKDINIGAKFNIAQGVSLQSGFHISEQEKNTLEYVSNNNYLVFGVQLIPFYLGLYGQRSQAQPLLYCEFDKAELRKWTGEIFNQQFNQEFNKKLINSIQENQ